MTERLSKVTQTWVDEGGKEREAVTEYDEQGAAKSADAEATVPQGELPSDFPGRDIYRRAGYTTIEALEQFRRRGPFTRIEGIDSVTAQATEILLATMPKDEAKAAAAASADAKAQGTQTKVSEGGGGSEATGPIPPAPGPIPAGKPGTGEMSAKAGQAGSKQGVPAQAGHGTEGFIVSAGEGSHLGTNLTPMSGATKTKPADIGEDAPELDTSLRGKLAEDFPHKAELEAADLGTYGKLRKAVGKEDWYKEIAGVGEARAIAIREALAAKPEEEDED